MDPDLDIYGLLGPASSVGTMADGKVAIAGKEPGCRSKDTRSLKGLGQNGVQLAGFNQDLAWVILGFNVTDTALVGRNQRHALDNE